MNKLRRFGKRMQMSVVQYRVRRSSAKHETAARDIKIECGARDLSFEKTEKPSAKHDTVILGSAESAKLSISSEANENFQHRGRQIVAVTSRRLFLTIIVENKRVILSGLRRKKEVEHEA